MSDVMRMNESWHAYMCVYVDLSTRVRRLTHSVEIHVYVCHVIRLNVCDVTYVSLCDVTPVYVCDMTHVCVTWLMCLWYVRTTWFMCMCVTWLMCVCVLWLTWFMCMVATWLIYTRVMTHNVTYSCVTWLIYTNNMTRSCEMNHS